MNKVKFRNYIIVILCSTIIFLSIGFCVLSTKFNEYKSIEPQYDVSIDKVTVEKVINGGDIKPVGTYKILNNDKTIDFLFNLYFPNDQLVYNVIIKNKGNISAKIDKVIESNNYDKKSLYPITISYNDIEGKKLEKNEDICLRVTVTYNNGLAINTKIPYELSILTSYVK